MICNLKRLLASFLNLAKQYPEQPAPHFLLGLNRWWESYVAPQMETYHPYILEQLDKAISYNQTLKGNQEWELEYTFFQYMSYAFKARLYTLRKEWLKAANAGRKAFPYLKKGFEFQEQSPEFYFGSGIYHYYADEYPKSHPIIQPFMIFFPEASAELGIEELSKAYSTPNFAQFEAAYYLGDIYLKRGSLKNGLKLQKWLHEQCPRNTWFAMEYGRALVAVGEYAQADQVLGKLVGAFERIPGHKQRHIPTTENHHTSYLMSRVYLWWGKSLYMQGKKSQATDILQTGLQMAQLAQLTTDDEYLPGLYFFLAKSYGDLGNDTKAEEYFKLVMKCSQNAPFKEQTRLALKGE